MNKNILEDYQRSERDRGVQIKKIVFYCSQAMAENSHKLAGLFWAIKLLIYYLINADLRYGRSGR